jgi:hypothetical protein
VDCYYAAYAYAVLGFFPSTPGGKRKLAEAVRKVRDALGCRLSVQSKEVADAKKRTVCITLHPADFPTIRVQYTCKLPKGAKCIIVRSVSRFSSLVCEL